MYTYCSKELLIIPVLGVILLFFFIFKNKKKNINYSVLISSHPEVLINDIINAFYFSHIHGKHITICLFSHKIFPLSDKYIIIKAVFNSLLVKFLMHSTYNYFVFFISQEGIVEAVYFDNNFIDFNNENNFLLIINHSVENNLFDLRQGGIVLKNNNTQKTIHIIKEILKNNT